MDVLIGQSPAKINLTLRVLGRRADGYHELESLVVRLGLADTVRVSLRRDGLRTLTCDDDRIPCDERNLALQAAARLAEATACRQGAHIELHKRVPPGAGLGGGSSNAATVLKLLNELWQLGLSRAELTPIAAEIGSDVPLFLHGPVCLLRGRGERVEEVRSRLSTPVVLFLPELQSSTRVVYEQRDRLPAPAERPPLTAVLARLHAPTALASLLFNDLEAPAQAAYPELRAVANRLRAQCPAPVCMTGSGAGFFCLATKPEDVATKATAALAGGPVGVRVLVTATEAANPPG